jgi:uncharacterized protein YqfA (UPF0365 family)
VEQGLIIAAAFLGVILLCVFFVNCLLPWFFARSSGVRVSFFRVLFMALRRCSPRRVLQAAILAKKGEVEAPLHYLEAHLLAGGNSAHVVLGLIAAKEAGVRTSFPELAAVDLQGEDVLAFVRKGAESQSGRVT